MIIVSAMCIHNAVRPEQGIEGPTALFVLRYLSTNGHGLTETMIIIWSCFHLAGLYAIVAAREKLYSHGHIFVSLTVGKCRMQAAACGYGADRPLTPAGDKQMTSVDSEVPVLYSDKLVEITADSILFRHYYFPFGSKTVLFSAIKGIETRTPSLANGKWRIHGTGDFRTWFPCDWSRPRRDMIFIMSLTNRWGRIGFTVEDSQRVCALFADKGLLKHDRGEK